MLGTASDQLVPPGWTRPRLDLLAHPDPYLRICDKRGGRTGGPTRRRARARMVGQRAGQRLRRANRPVTDWRLLWKKG